MTSTLAFLFPGQGSQAVGMQTGLSHERFVEADRVLGFLLSRLIAEGPESELQRTENTQPAILATSLGWADHLAARGLRPVAVAGHSLGEYSALVYAEAMDYADALRLVRLRGQAMQSAVPEGQGAMAAIVGLSARTVADSCSEASIDVSSACQPANFNGGGQVAIAGHSEAVERAMTLCKEKGAKLCKRLPVSAPFHSALMAPAARELEEALATVTIRAPSLPVLSNVTAKPHTTANEIRHLLVEQVTASVRWEESVLALVESGITEAFEVGPGRVLAGLVRRIAPQVRMRSLDEPSNIAKINEANRD